MMALFILTAAVELTPLADGPPPSPQAVKSEIARIEKSLGKWQGGAARKDGKLGCVTRQSTGDLELDAIRCAAVVKCFAPVASQLDTLESNAALSDEERKAKMIAIADTTKPCLATYTRKAVTALATRRARG